MRKFAAVFIFVVVIFASGCSKNTGPQTQTNIDWVDFIKLGGVTYLGVQSERGRALKEDDLDGTYSTIKYNISKNVNNRSYYPFQSGDAAFLDEGTMIYKVKGYSPKFRIAAQRDGRLVLYEADHVVDAKTATDYLDIQGKVQSIDIFSDAGGTSGRIEKPQEVNKAVKLLLASSITQKKAKEEGTRYFLAFNLADGTVTTRVYFKDEARFFRDIVVSQEFVQLINNAVTMDKAKPGA